MPTRSKSIAWRLTLYLLLFSLLFSPAAGLSAQAAPPPQDSGPESTEALEPPAVPEGTAGSGEHLITNVSLGPDTPNILAFNDNVNLNFNYATTQVGGVYIFARPYTSFCRESRQTPSGAGGSDRSGLRAL
jgi:hypothetical protein